MLQCRQALADNINKIFGLDVSVRFSQPWEIEYRKYVSNDTDQDGQPDAIETPEPSEQPEQTEQTEQTAPEGEPGEPTEPQEPTEQTEPTDLYKLVFQDMYGPGHLLTDSTAALRYINAEGNGISSTAALASLTDLNELYLAFNPLEDFSGLCSLGNLRRLGLESTGLTDEKLKELSVMESLDLLRIHDNPALTGEAVDALKAELRGCKIQHSDLIYFVEIGGEKIREDATEVDLFGRGITDISLINKLKKVEKLDLGANDIENIYSFQFLGAPLRELRLGNNRISDGTALMYLNSLELLDISGNELSSLSPIKLMTSLKWLKLSGNPISEEQVDELRVALPDCEIIFEQ